MPSRGGRGGDKKVKVRFNIGQGEGGEVAKVKKNKIKLPTKDFGSQWVHMLQWVSEMDHVDGLLHGIRMVVCGSA